MLASPQSVIVKPVVTGPASKFHKPAVPKHLNLGRIVVCQAKDDQAVGLVSRRTAAAVFSVVLSASPGLDPPETLSFVIILECFQISLICFKFDRWLTLLNGLSAGGVPYIRTV
jgi:hypothetical protein